MPSSSESNHLRDINLSHFSIRLVYFLARSQCGALLVRPHYRLLLIWFRGQIGIGLS